VRFKNICAYYTEIVILKSYSEGEWQLNQMLYVDGTALVAGEEYKLQKLVSEFGSV
jgi:hypothetical protein